MEATNKRHIKSGEPYNHLFPTAVGNNATIRKNANVYHTVAFIPKVVQETLHQTQELAKCLQGNSLYETCKNIWQFVYEHINYKKDAPGYEQIRNPARVWHDRFSGVDCDCYSVFISSILSNLGIPHSLRITKYHRDYFQHIYPIVPASSPTPKRDREEYITMDCVTERFNYEVPFSEKKDYPMDLQYLNGLEATPALYSDPNETYLLGAGDGMAELGKLIQRKIGGGKKTTPLQSKTPAKKQMPLLQRKATLLKEGKPAKPNFMLNPATGGGTPKKKPLGKMLNIVNKVNPATVLLRNGILASMKLNTRNVAARLRWSYLTPEQAASKSIDPVRLQKLIAARQKLEKIFFGAGGNPANLKKAILAGKGNKDKAVQGLEGFGPIDMNSVQYLSEYTPMSRLLGNEIYADENSNGMKGFGGFGQLGEPITLSSIAAAAGVIAGIVAMLKDVGNIFQKKTKDAEDFDAAKNAAAEKEVPVTATPPILPEVTTKENTTLPESPLPAGNSNTPVSTDNALVKTSPVTNSEPNTSSQNENIPATSGENTVTNQETPDNNNPDPGFWEKNKQWLKPVAIGVGGLTIIGIGYALLQNGNQKNKSSPAVNGLTGIPAYKRKNHKRPKSKHHKKRAIALL